jgi:hypothetical protein
VHCFLPLDPVCGVAFHESGADIRACAPLKDRTRGLLLLFVRSAALRARLLARYRPELSCVPSWLCDPGHVRESAVPEFFAWLFMDSAAHCGIAHIDVVLAFMFEVVVVAQVKSKDRR